MCLMANWPPAEVDPRELADFIRFWAAVSDTAAHFVY